MRKYLPYLICLLSLVVFIVLIFILKPNINKDTIISLEKNYNICLSDNAFNENNNIINIKIYCNNLKSYIIDKDQIKYSYLKNNENDEMIELKIIDIIKNNNEIQYENDIFYEFIFKFEILFKSDSFIEWYFLKTMLMIGYNGNNNYCINIGSFNYINIEKNSNALVISYLKPILSKINNNEVMTGIIIGLRKNIDYNVIIEKIKINNCYISIGNDFQILKRIPNQSTFKELFGYDYLNIKKSDGIINYKFENEENIYLLIPINYDEYILATNFPIQFDIIYNNINDKFYISNYTYFKPVKEIVQKEKVHVYNVL